MPDDKFIEASGGVLWRHAPTRSGVEIAVIHRPKYDDWSLPKGKLTSGEHVLLGAVREVEEETGHVASVGRPLGEIRYNKDGSPKRVRYWSMKAVDGTFAANDEVDELRWLEPIEARQLLSPDRDRDILDAYVRDMTPTWPIVVVRHAQAGERSSFAGDDRERPLTPSGEEQASGLTEVLMAYGIERLLSADVLRCMETVAPYAAALQLTIESEPLVSETGYLDHPDAALERFLDVVSTPRPTAVCSQGKTIPELLARTCTALGHEPSQDTSVRKGGWWALHMSSPDHPRLIAIERFDPI